MKTLSHTDLERMMRKSANAVKNRFWIAVPYIGGWEAVKCVIGNQWIKNEQIDVRLLTDIDEKSAFSAKTLQIFRRRALVRHLQDLHAKIYIFDDNAIVTSANLTERAFYYRHEIGLFLENEEAKDTIRKFMELWEVSSEIKEGQWEYFKSETVNCIEDRVRKNSKRHTTPSPPPRKEDGPPNVKGLAAFNNIVQEYGYFVEEYRKALRILGHERFWSKVPIYLETDAFLNFLFTMKASGKPSKPFSEQSSKPKQFDSNEKRLELIKQEVQNFRRYSEGNPSYIDYEVKQTTIVREYLNLKTIDNLGVEELKVILKQINAITADKKLQDFKINQIAKTEHLPNLRNGLKALLTNEDDSLISQQMANLKALRVGMGHHVVCEIIANLYPEKYPKINANSLAGLRYFGYNVSPSLS